MTHDIRPPLVDLRGTLNQIPIRRTSLYALIDAGELTRVKVGGRAFITQASIDAYVERLTSEAEARFKVDAREVGALK